MLSIERIDSAAAFTGIRNEWDDLLTRSGSDCIFLTHEWLSAWWKHLAANRKLHIIAVREAGRLVGLLPVCMRNPQYTRMMPQMLEFIGSGVIGSDYLDAIVDGECEDDVLEALANELASTRLMLQFNQVRRGSSLALRLAARLNGRNWGLSEVRTNICPFIPLAGHTWQTYLNGLG